MGAARGSQLALDGLHVEVFVDTINFAVRDMEHKAAQELIVLLSGLERDRRKVRLIGQRASRAVFQTGKVLAGKHIHHGFDPVGRRGPVVRGQLGDLPFPLERVTGRDNQPFDVVIDHLQDWVQIFAEERVEVGVHHLQIVLNTLHPRLEICFANGSSGLWLLCFSVHVGVLHSFFLLWLTMCCEMGVHFGIS